jgi:two-component system nitrate/nitrite response regulator NarL
MSGSEHGPRWSVAVASEQALVADAVRASLASRDFRASTMRWPGEQWSLRRAEAREEPEVGLLISDLDRSSRLRAASLILERVQVPWIVLTAAPEGPMWGAALASGARIVLPSSTGFDEVCEAVVEVAGGRLATPADERDRLVALWSSLLERRDLLEQRLQSLTPRENEVLRLLYAGDPVSRIAQLLEVSPATVRSQVKSVLRKLDVNSQLGAVAMVGDMASFAGEPGDELLAAL